MHHRYLRDCRVAHLSTRATHEIAPFDLNTAKIEGVSFKTLPPSDPSTLLTREICSFLSWLRSSSSSTKLTNRRTMATRSTYFVLS
ncbi:hypothetical protein L2E82_47426 [Cichorium intybus]|uniref:Uncharacterized protein n=1 Tax=Cichorium intybus TaxID=13427 RepID=A0ACB8YWY7_CICIN|nr:hypothetical protein L2E82_47426 [Cichorium intybus]